MLIRELRSVWVPYEVSDPADREGQVCNDIPRFAHPEECKDFLGLNQRRLGSRLIQFREHYEPEFKFQFAQGVGHKDYWRVGPRYDPRDIPAERHGDRDY